jgi:hypothetical protein
MKRKDLDLRYFCCTTLLGVIFMERCFHECYANESRTTTCSGVLGRRTGCCFPLFERIFLYNTIIKKKKVLGIIKKRKFVFRRFKPNFSTTFKQGLILKK